MERILLHVAFTQRLRHIKPWGPSGHIRILPCWGWLKPLRGRHALHLQKRMSLGDIDRDKKREQPTNRTICNSGKSNRLFPLFPHALKGLQLRDKPRKGPVSGRWSLPSLPPAPLSDFGESGGGFLLVTRFNLHQGSLSRAPTSG